MKFKNAQFVYIYTLSVNCLFLPQKDWKILLHFSYKVLIIFSQPTIESNRNQTAPAFGSLIRFSTIFTWVDFKFCTSTGPEESTLCSDILLFLFSVSANECNELQAIISELNGVSYNYPIVVHNSVNLPSLFFFFVKNLRISGCRVTAIFII